VLVVLGFFTFRFLMLRPVPSALVTITAPDQILIGDPFVISIAVQNTSDVVLKNVKLDLTVPSNVSIVGESQSQTTDSFSIGDIATGTMVTQTSTLIATSGVGTTALLTVRAASGENQAAQAQFQTNGSLKISVGDPAIGLSVSAPESAIVGSPIGITLAYVNNSPDTIGDVRVVLDTPPAFAFGASSTGVGNGESWDVGALAPRARGTVTAYGMLTSAAATTYGFAGSVVIATNSNEYAIIGPTANVELHQPPLSLEITANGSSSYVATLGDFLSYTIHYANHASVALQGVTVRAKLTGSMFDLATVDGNGSFDSRNNIFSWSSSAVPALASVPPGASGDLALRVRLLRNFPISRASDKNFIVRVDGTVASPTILPGVVATSTAFVVSATTKVAGGIAISSRGYHVDGASKIVNAGPYPPIVNRETQYTIHWTVTDSADDLQNVVLSADLPTGIVFTGNVTSNVSTTPQYNSTTGIVTWTIPAIPATAGIVVRAREAVFQIAATPAVNQVGESFALLGETSAQATDIFTGLPVVSTADAITTTLPDDPVARQVRDNTVHAR
jgi:hypothetical protein